MAGDVLTQEMLDALSTLPNSPQRHYSPINAKMWDACLKLGFTEKHLANLGFIKSEYLEL